MLRTFPHMKFDGVLRFHFGHFFAHELRHKKNALFWPRPIFAGGEPPTIVSAEAFQDSVRDGKSWDHLALETRIKRF